MKRNIFIVLTLALVCVLFVACGKDTSGNQELENLRKLQSGIQSRIDEDEPKEEVFVYATRELVEQKLSETPFTGVDEALEESRDPYGVADKLYKLGIVSSQDKEKLAVYLGTHPDDMLDCVIAYAYFCTYEAEYKDRVCEVPEATEALEKLCAEIGFGKK